MEIKSFVSTSKTGAIVPNSKAYIYLQDSNTLAEIYDRVGLKITNPLTSDINGFFEFAAENGGYDIQFELNDGTKGVKFGIEFSDTKDIKITADNALNSSTANTLSIAEINTRIDNISASTVSIDNITALRATTPASPNIVVRVTAYSSTWKSDLSGPVGGGLFYYDATDTTTSDDGVFTFVTASGARWKRLLNSPVYNLNLGGIRTGDDATTVLKTLVAKLLEKYTSKTTTDLIPISYGNGSIEVDPGTYIISSPVQLYTVTPINVMGDVTFDGRSITTGSIFKLSNDGFGVAYSPKYFNGGVLLNGTRGRINIVGSQKVPGVTVGNTTTNNVHCTGWLLHNVHIAYCTPFISFNGAVDTYLLNFSRIGAYGSTGHGIQFAQTTSVNSGERISFDEVTISGCTGDAIYCSQPGIMVSMSNLSIDFVNGNGINLAAGATYASFDVSCGSHAEAIDGYFIRNVSSTNKITWDGGQWLPTSRTNGNNANYFGRTLVQGSIQSVRLRDIMILNTQVADNANVFIGVPSDPSTRVTFEVTGIQDYYGYVPSVFDIANVGYNFSSETVGAVLNDTNTSLTKFGKTADNQFWLAGCTASVIDQSGDKALQIVPNTTGLTTNYIVLAALDYIPVIPAKTRIKAWVVGQVLQSALRVRVQTSVKWYDADKKLISTTSSGGLSDLYTNSQIKTQPSYSADATINGNRKLASLANTQIAPAGAVFARAVFTISGIDQTININQLCCSVV